MLRVKRLHIPSRTVWSHHLTQSLVNDVIRGPCSDVVTPCSAGRGIPWHQWHLPCMLSSMGIVLIEPERVKGAYDRISVACNQCGHQWSPSARDYVDGASKCSTSCSSPGKDRLKRVLDDKQILYERAKVVRLTGTNLRLDFQFEYQGQLCAIEFDNEHHFVLDYFFHSGDSAVFEDAFGQDMAKTLYCKRSGIHLLRISFKEDTDESVQQSVSGFLASVTSFRGHSSTSPQDEEPVLQFSNRGLYHDQQLQFEVELGGIARY